MEEKAFDADVDVAFVANTKALALQVGQTEVVIRLDVIRLQSYKANSRSYFDILEINSWVGLLLLR